ncbi:MAG: hypothetical protein ACK41P_05165 [Asticcacaulis sp.]
MRRKPPPSGSDRPVKGSGLDRKQPQSDKDKAARAALKALEKARKAAQKAEKPLTEWEDEFLTSVEGALKTYGRAFSDPDKGAPGTVLSLRQGLKLKEIRKKSAPNPPTEKVRRSGFSRKPDTVAKPKPWIRDDTPPEEAE